MVQKLDAAKKLGKKMSQSFFQWLTDPKNRPVVFFYVLTLLLIFGALKFYDYKTNLKIKNDDEIKELYKEGTQIGNMPITHKHGLRDYYILGSYNSCCGGSINNDFVSLVPLKEVIKQGARVLDFELYSKDGKAIIAAAPDSEPNEKVVLKGSYNHIDLDALFKTIETYAFGAGLAPNPKDPLFLSFRIRTENANVINQLAKKIQDVFGRRLLSSQLGNEGKYASKKSNMQTVKIRDLWNKVIIMVDDPKNTYQGTNLVELINLSTKMPNYRVLRNYDIVFGHDMSELTESNKKGVTLTLPDAVADDKNPKIILHQKYGCQMCLSNFSVNDTNHKFFLRKFQEAGTAFILKPEHLRYKEVKIKPPKDQNVNVSYKERNEGTEVVDFKL